MKDLYTFTVTRELKAEEGGNPKTEEVKVIIKKPNHSMIEDGEFYYATKFNEMINAGFLSKAMMQKKFSDLGGNIGKANMEELQNEFLNLYDAQRVVEFFGGAKEEDLNDEQKEKLKKAEATLVESRRLLIEQNMYLTSMFQQTADAQAQTKLMKWFAFFCSFYEESAGKKVEEFELFEGSNLAEKESFYSLIMDENYDEEDLDVVKRADIIKQVSSKIGQVLALWYNGLGDDQESLDEQIANIEKEQQEEAERLKEVEEEGSEE